MVRKLALLLLSLPSLCLAQTYYNQTTIEPGDALVGDATGWLSSTATLVLPGTYTRCTAGQNSFCSTMTLTGTENNAEYGAVDFLMSPGAFTNSFTSSLTTALKVKTGVNNASAVGGFGGMQSIVSIDGATGNSTGAGAGYVSGTFIAQSAINDNGGSGTEKGFLYGLNPNVRLNSGATFWQQIIGEEIDLAVTAGASVLDKIGMQIVQGGTDATQGSRDNIALTVNSVASASKWEMGLSFGNYVGHWPMSATATLVGCKAHAFSGSCGTTLNGVDFSNVVFTGSAFKSTGFSVDASGNLTANNFSTSTYSNATLSINKNASTNTTDIGTGTTSGTVTIGGGSDVITLNGLTMGASAPTLSINANSSTNVTNIGTGSTSGTVTIGGGSDSVSINAGTSATLKGTTAIINANASTNVTNIGTGTTSGAVNIGNSTNIVHLGPTLKDLGTTFTTSAFTGCGTTNGTPTGVTGTATTGTFVSASSGTTCSVVITPNGATGFTAPNGWYCTGQDMTTLVQLNQSAKSQTTCTLRGTIGAITDNILINAVPF
jgi:hypothetical protein